MTMLGFDELWHVLSNLDESVQIEANTWSYDQGATPSVTAQALGPEAPSGRPKSLSGKEEETIGGERSQPRGLEPNLGGLPRGFEPNLGG